MSTLNLAETCFSFHDKSKLKTSIYRSFGNNNSFKCENPNRKPKLNNENELVSFYSEKKLKVLEKQWLLEFHIIGIAFMK